MATNKELQDQLKKALEAKKAAESKAADSESKLTKAVTERNEAVNALEAAKAASSPADVEKIEALTAERDEAVEKTIELQKQLDAAPVNNRIPGTIKIDGKKWKFKDGFKEFTLKLDGKMQKVKAVDCLKSEEIMAHLVDIKFGGIELAK